MLTFDLGLLMVGASLAGFWDAWAIHHLLGWHHMYCVSSDCLARTSHEMRLMEVTDAAFHAAMWTTNILGIASTLHALKAMGDVSRLRWRYFIGKVLQGCGSFQVVEGVVDHFLLGLHRVNPRSTWPGPLVWDILFLLIGAGMYGIGWFLCRPGRERQLSLPDSGAASEGSPHARVASRVRQHSHERTAEAAEDAAEVNVTDGRQHSRASDEETVQFLSGKREVSPTHDSILTENGHRPADERERVGSATRRRSLPVEGADRDV